MNCLYKKGICDPNLDFLRDVRKYTFEDYCGLSFIRRYKFPYSYSFLTKKKQKKTKKNKRF